MRSRFLRVGYGLVIAGVAGGLVGLAACSTSAKLLGNGEQCFAATDCQDGLVCVPQASGISACSSDISGIVHEEDAAKPNEAAAPKDGAKTDAPPAGDGGGSPDSAAQPDSAMQPDTAAQPDTSAPDTSAPDATAD